MASTAAALSITAAAAAATASASAAVKKPTAAKVNVLELVTHLDYALMAVVGLFVLAAVPRLVYRFSRIAEWRGPHILRRGEPAFEHANYGGGAKVYMEDDGASVFSAREFAAGATTEDHHYIPTRAAPIPRTEPAPLRARSYASHFPRIAAVFRAPIYAGGMPISHFLILLIYFVFVTYATLYKSSPFSDGRRTGFVSVSQLPILIALAMKNNPAGMIVGLSYEKINYIHRFAGRLAILCGNLHAFYYIYKWSMAGTITTSFQKPYLAWGLACLAWFDLLWICSLDVIRSRAYNLFKTVHCVSAVFILVTVYMHVPSIAPFVFAAVAVYAFDTAIRLFKTRLVTGTLTAQGKMTKLTLPLGAGWRAGHHVRVRVLSTRIGVLRWAEAHPFTVASAPGGGSQLELLIQPAGTWTNQLGAIARGEFSDNNEKGVDMGVPVRVVVEGPYGGVGHARVAGCTGALIVAGGSGMSFALGALDELAHHPGHMRHAQIVWSVPEPSALAPFLDRLRALLKAAERRGLDVRVRVHYTRALQDPDLRLFLPPGVSIRAGRPPLPKILHSAAERALRAVGRASGKPSGFWVGVCGPEGLSESVARAVSGVDPALRVSVGGVEFHREMFGM